MRRLSGLQEIRPTRLPHPWDSPGKNTGVGCHFLLQCMKVKSSPPGSSVRGIFQARVLGGPGIALQAMQEKKALSSRERGRLRGFLELRRGEGERVLALESREGTRDSRRVEEGLSRSFSWRRGMAGWGAQTKRWAEGIRVPGPLAGGGSTTARGKLRLCPASACPHERLPEILVVPREKTPTGAAARGNP